jgi:hypothetical protein
MLKNIICIAWISGALFSQKVAGSGLEDQVIILNNYETLENDTIINIVRNDLLSQDPLLQDAGCIILLKTLDRLKKDDTGAEYIFTRLAGDDSVVNCATGIIDSRLLGWYNGASSTENDGDLQIYIPLFHILGKADSKSAKGTLVRSFLCLHGRQGVFDGIPMSEDLVAISLKRLKIIGDKLCCLYPGRDLVVAMLEKNLRFNMLDVFAGVLMANKGISEKTKKEIKNFIIECMDYGDSKNGYLIRMRAVKMAGMLLNGGEKDLAWKIEDLSRNDPYYVHSYNDTSGYSITELKYPVRELSKTLIR